MALAAAGQKYLWTKPGTPPPAGGNVLYFRYLINQVAGMLALLILGAR